MADSKMAVLADWRLAFGHPFSQMAAIFSQNGSFFVKLMVKLGGFFSQTGIFIVKFEIPIIIFREIN